MTVVRIPDENRTLTDAGEITEYLAGVGIEYGKVPPAMEEQLGAIAEIVSVISVLAMLL